MLRTVSTVRRSRAAVGAVLAAAALTACGATPPHPGAAAVIGGERITVAQVEARVSAIRADAAALPGAKAQEPSGLARFAVYELVLERLVDRALTDRQLSVSSAEVAQARQNEAQGIGGEEKFRQYLLFKQLVPADGIDAYYRRQLGIAKLAAAAGQNGLTPAGDETVRKTLAATAAELKIDLNPRYGHWDAQQVGIGETTADWLPRNGTPA